MVAALLAVELAVLAAPDSPPFKELYDLLRTNLAGVTEAEHSADFIAAHFENKTKQAAGFLTADPAKSGIFLNCR